MVNTPAFQRLRRIHQLALTSLVFPGATHTRFEHGLGTMHLSGRLADRVAADDPSQGLVADRRRVVRLAGLVHDIGHGPFSHVADVFLNAGGREGHEEIGALIVEQDAAVSAALGADSSEVARLLRKADRRTVERDIVSGPADADKADYLVRDSQFAGVKQGLFDVDRLIDQATFVSLGHETYLGFLASGMTAVESMRLARHHMHRTVYGHRNRLVTDFMLQRGIRDALDRQLLPANLLTVPASGEFDAWWREYRMWDDWRMTTELVNADGLAGEMFRRLRNHELPKLLVHLDSRAFHSRLGLETVAAFGAGLGPEDQLAVEAELAGRLGERAEDVIVQIFDPKRSLGRLVTDPIEEDDIIIVDETRPEPDRYEKFDARSEIFGPPRGEPMRELLVYSSIGRKADLARADRASDWVIAALRERGSGRQ